MNYNKLKKHRSRHLRIHHLQHVPYEGLGSMQSALEARQHQLTATHLYLGQGLPKVQDLDWLIVMGGPMSVSDESLYPWLKEEKKLILQVLQAGKKVLGICLGAQLIAEALGAHVYPNPQPEIGWFGIERTATAADTFLASALPPRGEVFHWHSDTFDLPEGATALAHSETCKNQGFVVGEQVVALQFHLEITVAGARALIADAPYALKRPGDYIQPAQEMLAKPKRFAEINRIMARVLRAMESTNT